MMISNETLYNTDQLNWDAINTISNIILVLALVLITVWYAHEVRKQTRIMIKDRERAKILEEVQAILTPIINHIKIEIDAIENKKIFWHRYTSETCGFDSGLKRLFYNEQYGSVKSLFGKRDSEIIEDILIKFSKLYNNFSYHDFLIDEINQCFEEIEKEIKTKELKEWLEELTEEFNKGKSAAYRLKGDSKEYPFKIFSEYVINIEYIVQRSSEPIEPIIDFWEKNKEELLAFRKTPEINELSINMNVKIKNVKKIDDELLKKLYKMREKYREDYNFTSDEIEPFERI